MRGILFFLVVLSNFANFGFAAKISCPYQLAFGLTPEQAKSEYQKLIDCGKIKGRAGKRLPNKYQEELLVNLLLPVAGLELIKKDPEGEACEDYRLLTYHGEILIIELGAKSKHVMLEFRPGTSLDEPQLFQDTSKNKLALNDKVRTDPSWVQRFARSTLVPLFQGTQFEKRVQDMLTGPESAKIMSLLPFSQSTLTKAVQPAENISASLPGALTFDQITSTMTVMHPVYGYLDIQGKSADDNGTLNVYLYRDSTVTKIPNQAHVVMATVGSDAAKEISRARAREFAPNSNVALLFLTDYLLYLKSEKPNYFKHLAQIFENEFNQEILPNFEKWLLSLKMRLITFGIRHDETERLESSKKIALQFCKIIKTKLGTDLVKDSLLSWSREEEEVYHWPNLGLNPHIRSQEGNALSKQIVFQKFDILKVFLHEILRDGWKVFQDALPETLFTLPHPEAQQIDGLFAYFTPSHPLHEEDWMTTDMAELKEITLKKGYKNRYEAYRKAREIVLTYVPELKATGLFEADRFDVITNVIGSDEEKNRAYYLAEELVDYFEIDRSKRLNVFRYHPDWEGEAQKIQNGLVDRMRNAASKFMVYRAANIVGKRVLLIEDTNTSGITIEECRRLLYEAGASLVHVLSFAQTVSQGQVSLLGTPLEKDEILRRQEEGKKRSWMTAKEWISNLRIQFSKGPAATPKLLELLQEKRIFDYYEEAHEDIEAELFTQIQTARNDRILKTLWQVVHDSGRPELIIKVIDFITDKYVHGHFSNLEKPARELLDSVLQDKDNPAHEVVLKRLMAKVKYNSPASSNARNLLFGVAQLENVHVDTLLDLYESGQIEIYDPREMRTGLSFLGERLKNDPPRQERLIKIVEGSRQEAQLELFSRPSYYRSSVLPLLIEKIKTSHNGHLNRVYELVREKKLSEEEKKTLSEVLEKKLNRLLGLEQLRDCWEPLKLLGQLTTEKKAELVVTMLSKFQKRPRSIRPWLVNEIDSNLHFIKATPALADRLRELLYLLPATHQNILE